MIPRLFIRYIPLRLLPLLISIGACDLFWSSQQSLGYEQGIQLQVCCNVSKVKIWAFNSPAKFQISRLVFESDFPQIEDDLYSELQLSMCSDRSEPTIGWVGAKPGVKCTYSTGQTLNIPHGALPIPDWYVICYTLSDGCQTCRLDILCENDLTEACADRFILGSSPRASNNTIDYWIKAGDHFPFPNSSQVQLTTSIQRNSVPVDEQLLTIAAGEKKRLTISGLDANEVYDIRRCVEIRLTPSLTQDGRFNFVNTTSRLCSEEGYRTQPNTASVVPCLFWITVIITMFCILR